MVILIFEFTKEETVIYLKYLFISIFVIKKMLTRKKKDKLNDIPEENPDSFIQSIKVKDFISRYTSDIYDITDKEYIFWKENVAPSCVQNLKNTFTCVFCSKSIKSSAAIIRHYREQHFDYIPNGK
jgi:hypothetical protein